MFGDVARLGSNSNGSGYMLSLPDRTLKPEAISSIPRCARSTRPDELQCTFKKEVKAVPCKVVLREALRKRTERPT